MAQIAAKYTLYMLVYLGTYQPGRYPDTGYSAAEHGVPRHIFGARYLVSRKYIVSHLQSDWVSSLVDRSFEALGPFCEIPEAGL